MGNYFTFLTKPQSPNDQSKENNSSKAKKRKISDLNTEDDELTNSINIILNYNQNTEAINSIQAHSSRQEPEFVYGSLLNTQTSLSQSETRLFSSQSQNKKQPKLSLKTEQIKAELIKPSRKK